MQKTEYKKYLRQADYFKRKYNFYFFDLDKDDLAHDFLLKHLEKYKCKQEFKYFVIDILRKKLGRPDRDNQHKLNSKKSISMPEKFLEKSYYGELEEFEKFDEYKDIINKFRKNLSVIDAAIFNLWFFYGMNALEIADVFNVSNYTTSTKIKKMKEDLELLF
jgi:RNA polymerase sigma factor (sigma-70 family)